MTTLYRCPDGHFSSVARLPNEQGIRRCFFCPKVTEALLDTQYSFPTGIDPMLVIEVVRVGQWEKDAKDKEFFNLGADVWAIRYMGRCLTKDNEWEGEPQPSSRDDAFKARTRFTLEQALDLAKQAKVP